MRYWITDAWSNANGVSTATTAAATTSAALVAAATGVSTTTTSSTPTGLEVSLSLQDQGTAMVKSFLLGPL
jgi:cobalamin biosynthesis protein CbiD